MKIVFPYETSAHFANFEFGLKEMVLFKLGHYIMWVKRESFLLILSYMPQSRPLSMRPKVGKREDKF